MHNDDALANEVRVIALYADVGVARGVQGVGVAAGFLLGADQIQRSVNVLAGTSQVHVLLANGLLNEGRAAPGSDVVERVGVGRPLNAVYVQCVVEHLSCVLTRQSLLYRRVNVVEQTSQTCVGHGVLSPVCAGQTSLSCVVTCNNQQHLSCFLTGNGGVRVKLGSALAGDDAVGSAEVYIACCPVILSVSECTVHRLVCRSVGLAAVPDNEDHLRHLSTGYSAVRLEAAIGVTVDYTQSRQSVHSFGSLDVRRVRERRTGEHGECASKRQYQCKNLFEITTKIAKMGFACGILPKFPVFRTFSKNCDLFEIGNLWFRGCLFCRGLENFHSA